MADLALRYATHRRTYHGLQELQEGDYYGYKLGPNAYGKQMHRVWSALDELARLLREREADESPQAKGGEAQLSARYLFGPNQPDSFSEVLATFPNLTRLVKGASSERVANYTSDDVGYKTPDTLKEPLEPGTVLEERPGLLEVGHMLAHDGTNLFEHPNPPARIKTALAREAERERMMHANRFGQSPDQPDGEDANDFFDVQQITWSGGRLHQDKDTVRNAPRTQNADTIADMDLEQALKRVGLSLDQIRVVKAIGAGLEPRSSHAHRVLSMDRRHYERIRRSLESDQPAGMALAGLPEQLAIYNPPKNPRK
jgi:hypothetical protein